MRCEYIDKLINACAFVPDYKDNIGKVTKIYLKTGGCFVTRYSMRKVIDDFCTINLTDINKLRKLSAELIGGKNLKPIYVRKGVVMIPIKTTKPLVDGDKCFAYVNLHCIDDLYMDESIIRLNNGEEICYVESANAVKLRLAEGTILQNKVTLKGV
ncbi:hypothetical protein [Clostridium cellulovorans]|uniref:Uncharacterized protein n=1 Tax=Clostridium cellulovorans (strain ATCC 35296 / DSM 3052 / OCM 3 / 743B) TaxID=573061 RepID=D9SNN3_CLOC7|nr:hypothetical protein [Clostridium cellulovorans]ADL49904.1 hypothetical protein Clocel_0115 [Clostridium cellulovorans 743B]